MTTSTTTSTRPNLGDEPNMAELGQFPTAAALTYDGNGFFRHGRSHRILAGAIHYFRVHPGQWEDRLSRLKAMGLNTVDTYVAWNFHQPRATDVPDFSGWRDLERFIELAGSLGMDVIVRPGPYICAEWDNGGLPNWVTGRDDIALRCSDPVFQSQVEEWFDHLLPIIERQQAANGGPVVAVQIENEYGSYGDDHSYIRWNRDALLDRGITELLFTADGGTDYYLDGGAIEGTLAAATLGSRGDEAIEIWKRRRPGEPFLNIEFWNGWFDHWGEKHNTRDAADAAAEIRKILDGGGSICLYMAHGGTNFGLGSGSNHDGTKLQPTVTSYDSDAPVAEHGALTEKFHALRAEFLRLGTGSQEIPAELLARTPTLSPRQLALTRGPRMLDVVRHAAAPVRSLRPLSFEDLGLPAGMILYRAQASLPDRDTTIRIVDLHDRAYVHVNGQFVGLLDANSGWDGVTVRGDGSEVELEIVVENQGYINYGPRYGERKGILGGVLIDQRYVFHWDQTPVALADFDAARLAELQTAASGSTPETHTPETHTPNGLATATFLIDEPADTFIALPGFAKGFLWINGVLLGRYWQEGPQVTLYVPGPLLSPGENTIVVLELENFGVELELELRAQPELGSTTRHQESLL
ncbi:glycoside hydrolase family 35 protein [Pseudarthrobacter sp. NIBRBAC000502772]|uniref:glycoside hydrolase family 35 protein n=1 Tax=Pseudarthrobacter sp. NIBRBAC000502772 TaxID=2590775 RepID=UPI001FF07B31|nr:glycoside hydrolase family 35 protein [Pseudarthrobacter sp. NIBRBAC000502772]